MTKYCKVMFSSKLNGNTAGLIIEVDKLRGMTIGDVSRLFPYSEAMKMERVRISPVYDTWESAFNHQFEG